MAWFHQVVRRFLPRLVAVPVMTFISVSVVCGVSMNALAAPDNFSTSKRLAQRIYADETQTFYCGCPLRWQGGKGVVDLQRCGYAVRKNGPRALRIEWEHVMPAQQFGASMRCWQQGGRELCAAHDQRFQAMEADLFNLKPAIGEINGDRAHYRFALLPDVPKQHGQCEFKVDFARDLVEPRAAIRGDIARIYFYMSHQYAIGLPSAELQLMLTWHKADPVDARERQLHQRIAQQMGHDNPFVSGKLVPEQVFAAAARALQQQKNPIEMSGGNSDKKAVGNTDGSSAQVATQRSGAERADGHATSGSGEHAMLPVHGNKASKRFHLPHCPSYQRIAKANLQRFANPAEAIAAGYQLAGNCNPDPKPNP